jgi:hypothetical protein
MDRSGRASTENRHSLDWLAGTGYCFPEVDGKAGARHGHRAFSDSRRNEMGVKPLKTHDAAKYPFRAPE